VGVVEVSHLSHRLVGGRDLLDDVGFRVGDGEQVALVGANGSGKSTLMRLIAGDEPVQAGTVRVDGRLGVMRQFIGSIRDGSTVRDLLVSLASPAVQEAAAALTTAEATAVDDPMGYAAALAKWGEVGGYDAEVLWDTCTTVALRLPLEEAGDRPVTTLSGGEQKRLALEALLRSDADVLLLDEPDNYLDVPGKEWLEEALAASRKTVLIVSHDRQLLANVAQKVVTIEGKQAWTHGGSFATWHDARRARLERLAEDHRRHKEERERLVASMRELKRRAALSDNLASRARASETKLRHFDEQGPPPELPRGQSIRVKLEGGRTGKRAVVCEQLSLPGLVEPFDAEVVFGERVAILGLNGTGKSHFLRLLAGDASLAHTGRWRLGARVVPGYFNQMHDHPELVGRRLADVLLDHGLARGQAMASLRRYGLDGAADQVFETLSGGQQARLQVLLLELGGATLLLLDEPTDNLDLESAEALQDGLDRFEGTVVAVTHDRWFMRSFDRFLVFGRDGSVREQLAARM